MNHKSAILVAACRACGAADLHQILDLGATPIANALSEPGRAGREERFPLGVQLCEACSLVQVTHDLPADVIFGTEYPYFSGYSSSVIDRAERYVGDLVESRGLSEASLVVELGSNDGYLLRHLHRAGVPVLGVDPAAGPAQTAATLGIPNLQRFFGERIAHQIRADHGPADVVVANNVLAHVPDINDFAAGMAILLADEGIATIENPWVKTMVDHLAFDTIYHEHFSYLSSHAVARLFGRHGLYLNHVDELADVHGGSLRWHLSRCPGRSVDAERFLALETAAGVGQRRFYASFGERVAHAQQSLRTAVAELRGRGARVAAYGAAAKGATLLNTTGLTSAEIEFVVDKNPAKQGKAMPGCGVPIRPPDELVVQQPDYALLLAWNLADEIVAEQRAYLSAGGRFIVPITDDLRPRILGRSSAS